MLSVPTKRQAALQSNPLNGVPPSATGQADINPIHAVELESDSSSDESSLDIPPTLYHDTTPNQKEASVSHPKVSRPPIMSDGKVTPVVVRVFELRCENFFMNAKGGIADEQKVTRLFGSFQNFLINDWIHCESTTLAALSFPEFMKEFRRRWLPTDWEHTVRSQIVAARFDPGKDRFDTWVRHVQILNIALRGTSSHFDDKQLRFRLEANLDEELWRLACLEMAHKIADLLSWIQKVGKIDNKRRRDGRKLIYDSAATVNHYPPRLTDEERDLLREHDGCFKCRAFYAGHRSDTCTVTLSGKGYKTLDIWDAFRAKVSKGIA